MARRLARRMLKRSISRESAMPTAQEADCSLIQSARRSRFLAVSSFESLMSGLKAPGSKTTAAATTGPASGPRPTSSTPATHRKPRESASVS